MTEEAVASIWRLAADAGTAVAVAACFTDVVGGTYGRTATGGLSDPEQGLCRGLCR